MTTVEPIIHALIAALLLSSLGALLAHWITFLFIVIALIWVGGNTIYTITHPEYTLEEI